MRSTETKDLYATLDAVTVHFDLEKRVSMPLSEELKKKIQCCLEQSGTVFLDLEF